MDDLISRQAAIDAVTPTVKSIMEGNSFKWFIVVEKLRQLPSAQPKQLWIPCSERLPEDDETVLVQFDDGDMDILTFPNIYKRLNRVAWMPLPEPWRGEEHETD